MAEMKVLNLFHLFLSSLQNHDLGEPLVSVVGAVAAWDPFRDKFPESLLSSASNIYELFLSRATSQLCILQ